MKLKFFIFFFLIPILTLAQDKMSFTSISFEPHIGISWQSTLFKPVFNFSPIQELSVSYFPYQWEKNTQGFGLDAGFLLSTNIDNRYSIGIKTNGRFRYDYLYGGFESHPDAEKEVKKFLFDGSGDVALIHRGKKRVGKDWIATLGFTANQIGNQKYFYVSYTNIPQMELLKFHYTSYHIGWSYDVMRLTEKLYLNAGLLINYIPKNHPAYPTRSFMTLGFTASVRYKDINIIKAKNAYKR